MKKFTVTCGKCQARQRIPESLRSRRVTCSSCGKEFIAWETETKPIQNSVGLLILLGVGVLLLVGILLSAFWQQLFNS